MTPVESAERLWEEKRNLALQRVLTLTRLFVAVQIVATVEFLASLVVLWRIDLDVLVTVGMIWSLSVPCAAGAAIFILRDWTRFALIERCAGIAPWSIVLLELTFAFWRAFPA